MDQQTIAFYKSLFCDVIVAGFRVEDFIAHGEFGLIFAGRDIRTSTPVALKIMPPNTDASANYEFKREGELLDRLKASSNVVDMLSSGQAVVPLATGTATLDFHIRYHALEYADGCLANLIAEPQFLGGISCLEKLRLWRQIVVAVHQMHLHKIVHRDLKSSNCLLFGNGSTVRCKVSDLGRSRDLAKPQRQNINYVNGRGDVRFAAPEHVFLQGKNSERDQIAADLYGLASIFFELFTGLGLTLTVIPDPVGAMRNALANYQQGKIEFRCTEAAV